MQCTCNYNTFIRGVKVLLSFSNLVWSGDSGSVLSDREISCFSISWEYVPLAFLRSQVRNENKNHKS